MAVRLAVQLAVGLAPVAMMTIMSKWDCCRTSCANYSERQVWTIGASVS